MKITIKESQLKSLIKEALDNVLYPKGGNIGGDHEKPIGDKDFDSYHGTDAQSYPKTTHRGFYTAQDKWKERFKDYFGIDNQDAIFNFIRFLKPQIDNYKSQMGGLYFRNAEANLALRFSYNPDEITKIIANQFNVDPKNPESVKKFALETFPQMEYEFQEFMKKQNFGQQ